MIGMIPLNLPTYEYKLKKTEDKIFIFDSSRKKYVVLTPEEWVRQHFINYLVTKLNYPKSLIKVESGLQFNKMRKRSDIVIYNQLGKPWMVVECKGPEHDVNRQTIQQVSVYNHTIKADYIGLTNGLNHFCCSVDHVKKTTTLLDQFPVFV